LRTSSPRVKDGSHAWTGCCGTTSHATFVERRDDAEPLISADCLWHRLISIARHQTMQPLTIDGTVNTEYVLVEPWLLPVASYPKLMQGAVDHLLENLARQVNEEVASRSRSQMGFMLTCLNRAAEAAQILRACARAQHLLGDLRGLVATELRLVQALQASNQVAAATEAGRAALARCTEDPTLFDLQHFAHHHLGKVMLQAGLYQQAKQHLQVALDLRQKSSDEELILSTQGALSLLRRLAVNTDA
jgi:tetratricopeptide (TPR) repeat protein